MNPAESLQYIAAVCNDFVRTLPASAQGPTGAALNEALQSLAPLVQQPEPGAMVNGDARATDEAQKRNAPGNDRRGHLD